MSCRTQPSYWYCSFLRPFWVHQLRGPERRYFREPDITVNCQSKKKFYLKKKNFFFAWNLATLFLSLDLHLIRIQFSTLKYSHPLSLSSMAADKLFNVDGRLTHPTSCWQGPMEDACWDFSLKPEGLLLEEFVQFMKSLAFWTYFMQLFLMYLSALWKYFLLTSVCELVTVFFRNCDCSCIYLQVSFIAARYLEQIFGEKEP